MALREMAKNLKGMMSAIGQRRGTVPDMKTYATTVDGLHKHSIKDELLPKGKPMGDYVPVYVALGMIMLSTLLGLHTVKQHLMYDPMVRVNKKRRETLPEVVEPDHVAHESENFIKKSYFRKLAHIQEFDISVPNNNPIVGNPLAREPRVESLKTVGIDPVGQNA